MFCREQYNSMKKHAYLVLIIHIKVIMELVTVIHIRCVEAVIKCHHHVHQYVIQDVDIKASTARSGGSN